MDDTSARNPSVLDVFRSRKMAALLLLGFAGGLPLFLTSQTLQAWLTIEGVSLTAIGFFGLLTVPFSWKVVWAPVLDRYIPPFLGRRRGWLLILQILLLVAIAAMSLHDPETGLFWLGVNALIVAFLTASQDVVGDAYRTDLLHTREMGVGVATWVLGYRIALLVTGALALIMADHMSWPTVYLIMASLMLVGIATTIWAPEPVLRDAPPQTLAQAVVLPFRDFFGRAGVKGGLAVLAFIVLYKLGDSLALFMSTPFLLQAGFTQTQIGAVKGGLGMFATIIGVLLGGGILVKLGINKCLWIFGGLQAVSNLFYYLLSLRGDDYGFLVATMIIENICMGLGTAGFLAFQMALCSKQFSATQLALLTSLTAVSRDVLSSPSGAIAEATGWPVFFLITIAAAVPGLLLLPVFAPWRQDMPRMAAAHDGAVEAPSTHDQLLGG